MSAFKVDEKMIENYLINHLEKIDLSLEGYNVIRQFSMAPYGTVDILTIGDSDIEVYINIVEIKAESLNINHLNQLMRYLTGFQLLTQKYFSNETFTISGTLITLPYIYRSSDEVFLWRQISEQMNISFYEYSFDLATGINIKKSNHSWERTSPFSQNPLRVVGKTVSDRQKYAFETIKEPDIPDSPFNYLMASLPLKKKLKAMVDIQENQRVKFSKDYRREIVSCLNKKSGDFPF